MGGHDPETVILPAEGVQAGALVHVPHLDALVFTVGQNQLLPRVEQGARDVVIVASAGVHFPRLTKYSPLKFGALREKKYLSVVHSPQFDLSIVGA